MNLTNIGVFGKRNVGKSTIVNLLLGQDFAIVSDTPGTTTDPVKKRIEIFGIGPCQIIDTAGIDDSGEIGMKRVQKTKEIISHIDIALLLFTANNFSKGEKDLLKELNTLKIPTILVHNQSDIIPMDKSVMTRLKEKYGLDIIEFSSNIIDQQKQNEMVKKLISLIVRASKESILVEKPIFDGLVREGDNVILICPVDSEAPTGRLILPQVMAIRDLLDKKAVAIVLLPSALQNHLSNNIKPDLVVTDSQVLDQVSAILPDEIPLTSFSMLLARSKGCFNYYIDGTPTISKLKDGDRILILESCTHHASCEDIGRVKLPNLFRKYTGKKLDFDVVAGFDNIKRNISDYALVAQCGGCMITSRQLYSRLYPAIEKNIPVTNYGMAIAYMLGHFDKTKLKPNIII